MDIAKLVDAAVAQEPVAVRAEFDVAMAEKIADRLSAMTPEIARAMFDKGTED